jgi:3-phosphoshikimate 1-carboxyvinyltransferase
MLRAMGAEIGCGEGLVRVAHQSEELNPISLRVPGDISATAAWLVLAALHPDAEVRIAGVGLNPTRSGVLDVLRMMGVDIRLEEERSCGPEPVADIVVRSSRLRGTVIEGDLIPRTIDELPLLALAGCLAEGETVIRDAAELRTKESDRIATTASELRRLGAEVEERADGLVVWGPQRLRGSVVSSHGDHRLAMMLGVAGALAQGETIIRRAGAIAVSYPWFWRDLETLAE